MQNYGQPVYERPGSTTSYPGPPPPPVPPYQQQQQQQQWGQQQQQQQQQQQAGPGYNPGTYGAMSGGYTQSSQYPPTAQSSDPYTPQYSDVPPPPPPKPYGFAAAVQKHNAHNVQSMQYGQDTQSWQQPQQASTGYSPQAQQGGYPVYNNAAPPPPPPSATPAASYFSSPRGARPGSIYGAEQPGMSASPVSQRPPSTVMSPNEQAPAYIPPSLSGQGTQAYMPSNTNPMPGVYVPPPPDIPAWQQAQHAPLQGGNKRFTYTKPTVDPSFYAQGYAGVQTSQQQPPHPPPAPYAHTVAPTQSTHQPYGTQPQGSHPPQGHAPQQSQLAHNQYSYPQQQQPPAHFGQIGQPVEPLQQQHTQSPVPQTYIQQQAAQLEQYAQNHQHHHSQQQVQNPVQSQNQWQAPAPTQHAHVQQQDASQPTHGYQQQQWQPEPQPHPSFAGQTYQPAPGQALQASKPVDHASTTPPGFVDQSIPHSQFVSPIVSQHPSSFASGHRTSASRTDSVSSIALANLHSQRADNRTVSPKPPSFKNPTPPPPRDDASRFSVLGAGGPSDWETLGHGEEIDDEALFAKKDRSYNEPVQLDSVELPAHQPSPPSTQGWPSPADQPALLNTSNRTESYQPTPPTATVSPVRTPSPRTPRQGFFAKDALAAPLRASPKDLQKYEAARDAKHGFVMGEVLWDVPDSPKQLGNASQQGQLPAPDTRGRDDAQVSAPVQMPASIRIPANNTLAPESQTPRQTRPGATRFFSDVGTTWGLSPKDKDRTQTCSPWGSKDDTDLPAKLKEKDEELWRLRRESRNEMHKVQAEIEAGKAEFLAEIDRLKAEEEAAKDLARRKSIALDEQVEAMKVAAEKAKIDADALRKENDLTIERIKEDIEGKEDTIKERDATIADLRAQLEDLRGQLEVEKAKEAPTSLQSAPADLIPDLDPWYAGSLERYITMLRNEANEPVVELKIKTFKAFLKAESGIRGIDYHDTTPSAPPSAQSMPSQATQPTGSQDSSGATAEKQDLNVIVPEKSSVEDDFEYSPGGRPMIRQPRTLPLERDIPTHTPFVPSSQSTAILTPTSSVHDDSTPIQSPPDEQSQPQYKAYVPPIMSPGVSASLAQRQATKSSNIPAVASPVGPGKNHDEIFFGAQESRTTKESNRPTSSDESGGVPVVAPLNFASSRPVSISMLPKGNALDTLISLLPVQIRSADPSPIVQELRTEAASIKSESKDVGELTRLWEKSASLTRRKNDDARRKRAEDNEAHNDDLFNSDEISYAELKDLETEFKEKERELKRTEDSDECKSYVKTVFDDVYASLQADITALVGLYIEAETLLQTSVSGVKSLGGGDVPTTRTCLELLVELHEQIEKTHEEVVQAVAERDKRYKKTELKPLYAAGNVAKMKSVEKHFEQAEKQAIHRAKHERAERVDELVKVAEEAVVSAASIEQSERSGIVSAIRDLESSDDSTSEILSRAQRTLDLLQESSKSLLGVFNCLEITLNTTEVEADIAQARVDGAPEAQIKDLEAGMSAKESELKMEFTRRIGVLEQDRAEYELLFVGKGGEAEANEEQEKEKRLKMALDEAKRRNGHA